MTDVFMQMQIGANVTNAKRIQRRDRGLLAREKEAFEIAKKPLIACPNSASNNQSCVERSASSRRLMSWNDESWWFLRPKPANLFSGRGIAYPLLTQICDPRF